MKSHNTPNSAVSAPSEPVVHPHQRAQRAEERLRQVPQDVDALFQLAEAYARLERHAEAHEAHRALLMADGRFADLHAGAGAQPASFIGGFDPVPCPVCGDPCGDVVWVGNISQQVRTWGHLDPVRQWVQCESCETLRVDAPPSPVALERWSAAQVDAPTAPPDSARFAADQSRWQGELDQIDHLGFGMAWLDAPGAPHPRLLEVGSGWGTFVASAVWRGFRASGVTTSEQAAWAAATLHVSCTPRDAHAGLAAEHLPEGEFDVIVLRESLDGAADPVAVLQAAAARLAPDGLLVLQVALRDHPIRRLQGYEDPHWSAPHRRVYYSRDTLEVTLARADLRSVSMRNPAHAPPGTALVYVRHDDLHDVMLGA